MLWPKLKCGVYALALGLCLTVRADPALGHEFLLKPVDDAGRAQVEAQAAHVFMVSEEMEALDDVELVMLNKDLAKTPLALAEAPQAKALRADLPEADGVCLVFGHRKPQLWSETTEDVLAGGRETLEPQGYKVLSVGKYEKFAKLILNADPADERVYRQPAGHPLEIELLSNPASLRPGDELRCRILWQGKPLQTAVKASCDGFSPEQDSYAVSVESDSEGVAAFRVTQPGLWFIRAGHQEALNDGSGADKWVVSAACIFEIR